MNPNLPRAQDQVAQHFLELAGNDEAAANACTGFEIGLALAMEDPEYARAFYLNLKQDDPEFIFTIAMAKKFVQHYPIERIYVEV